MAIVEAFASSEVGITYSDEPQGSRASGLERSMLRDVLGALSPDTLAQRDETAQLIEILHIQESADRIEEAFKEKDLPTPTLFVFYTAGFTAPDSAIELGKYGEDGPFEHFPKADIGGHSGKGSAIALGRGHSALLFEGRSHTYGGVGKEYAEMLYSRPLAVVRELMRRGRERGVESAVILTYLTGVDEDSPLKPGDLGVVIDHLELSGGRAGLSPGAGPHDILDRMTGNRFEPKAGRASDRPITQLFTKLARDRGIRVGGVLAVGTMGTTSYQGIGERALALTLFDRAKAIGLTALTEELFGEGEVPSLFYDMALSFDVDTVRQVIQKTHVDDPAQTYTEPDFSLLVVVLPTDSVGEGSGTVDHGKVVASALATGERNGALIAELLTTLTNDPSVLPPVSPPPAWVGPLSLQAQTADVP